MNTVRFTAVIKTREDEQRRYFGKAYIHTADGAQVTDWSGDQVDTPEAHAALEAAFYDYVKDSRSGDLSHELFGAADMIEGFIVTPEKKAAGLFPDDMDEGIYVGFEAKDTPAGDKLWDDVKTGRVKMLSIVGQGVEV